jgi:hypothetical protein
VMSAVLIGMRKAYQVLPGERLRLHLQTRQILVELACTERLLPLGKPLVEYNDREVLLALLQQLNLEMFSRFY